MICIVDSLNSRSIAVDDGGGSGGGGGAGSFSSFVISNGATTAVLIKTCVLGTTEVGLTGKVTGGVVLVSVEPIPNEIVLIYGVWIIHL